MPDTETTSPPPSTDVASTLVASTIVVGYSAKPEGRAALRRAIAEATLRHSRLIVVHSSADDELTGLQSELESSGITHTVRPVKDTLDPAEELLNTADVSSAEFIVIGLRRRSPVGKLLLGSNAQRVLLDASCPVLAVKAEPS